MTVKELIEELSQYGPDMMVVVNGYEGGFEELKAVKTIDLKLNYYRCSTDSSLDAEGMNEWMGPHESVDEAKDFEVDLIDRAKTEIYSWGRNPEHFSLGGAKVTAVLLPRQT
jgi:hypothetical protein